MAYTLRGCMHELAIRAAADGFDGGVEHEMLPPLYVGIEGAQCIQ